MKKILSTLFIVFGLNMLFSANAFADLITFRADTCPITEITFYQYDKNDGSLDRGYGHPFQNNGRNVKIFPHRTWKTALNLNNNQQYEYVIVYKYKTYYINPWGFEKIREFEKEISLDKMTHFYKLNCSGGTMIIKSLKDKIQYGTHKVRKKIHNFKNHTFKKIKKFQQKEGLR